MRTKLPVRFATAEGPCAMDGVLFTLDVSGVQMGEKYYGDFTNATVSPYSIGVEYKLVRMGAVVSNDTAGTYLANVDKKHTLDIPAVLLMELTETSAEYAVRVRYIPENKEDVDFMLRPFNWK